MNVNIDDVIQIGSQDLVREAIANCQYGSNRSAVIIIYIAVMNNLFEKLRALTSTHKDVHERIGNNKMALDVSSHDEAVLIAKCEEHGYLNVEQAVYLKQLKTLRNAIAHPPSINPQESTTRDIIAQGVRLFLSVDYLNANTIINDIISNVTSGSLLLSDFRDPRNRYLCQSAVQDLSIGDVHKLIGLMIQYYREAEEDSRNRIVWFLYYATVHLGDALFVKRILRPMLAMKGTHFSLIDIAIIQLKEFGKIDIETHHRIADGVEARQKIWLELGDSNEDFYRHYEAVLLLSKTINKPVMKLYLRSIRQAYCRKPSYYAYGDGGGAYLPLPFVTRFILQGYIKSIAQTKSVLNITSIVSLTVFVEEIRCRIPPVRMAILYVQLIGFEKFQNSDAQKLAERLRLAMADLARGLDITRLMARTERRRVLMMRAYGINAEDIALAAKALREKP